MVVAEETHGFPRGIIEWLQGCSVVLTGASMVAVEAMLIGVPVITMDFCNEIREVDFIDFGMTTHVTTPEALEATGRDVLAARSPSHGSAIARTDVSKSGIPCFGWPLDPTRRQGAARNDRGSTVKSFMQVMLNRPPAYHSRKSPCVVL